MSAPFGDGPCMHEALFDDTFPRRHRRHHARFRQGDDRRGLSSDDDVFPAGRAWRDADRADGIGIQGKSLDRFIHVLRMLALEAKAGKTRALRRRAALRPAPPSRRNRRRRANPCCAGSRRNLPPRRRNKKGPGWRETRGPGFRMSLQGYKEISCRFSPSFRREPWCSASPQAVSSCGWVRPFVRVRSVPLMRRWTGWRRSCRRRRAWRGPDWRPPDPRRETIAPLKSA